jgi:hypothetical protein
LVYCTFYSCTINANVKTGPLLFQRHRSLRYS